MADAVEPEEMQDDEIAAFERELEAVLALDPTDRINRLTGLAESLENDLKTGEQ